MGFFDKLIAGLTKSKHNLEGLEDLFQDYYLGSDDFYDELEELLIISDVGANTAAHICETMRAEAKERKARHGDEARECLVDILTNMLTVRSAELQLDTTPSVILMVGVNGVGKTTTIGKLASRFKAEGKSVLLCAGDTFRAAAAEQLEIWSKRSGVDIVKHEEGSDPAAVVYDSLCAAKARGTDIVLVDTAGRLHNKANLMNELSKIRRVIDRELPGASVETLMVLDATTGQNGLIQAQQFSATAGLTGIVLTKLDGTAKGGIVYAIANELELPVKFIGVGEGIDDLLPFEPKSFTEALFRDDK